MKFKVQYWLKSDIIDTMTTEVVFNNMTEVKDWLKAKLIPNDLADYNWTVLLDKTDVGEGHYTIMHSEVDAAEQFQKIEQIPKYKNWVKAFTKDIDDMLKKENIKLETSKIK